MSTAVVIVAAGRGSRAASVDRPKQYALIGGSATLTHAVRAFSAHPGIGPIQVVIHPGDRALYDAATAPLAGRVLPPVDGGASRMASVRAGLEALEPLAPHLVLVHDAARPFVSADVIDRVLAALETWPGAIAALPVADSLKRQGQDGLIAGSLDRGGLWRAQTPQGFHYRRLLAAHRAAEAERRRDYTDDAAVAERAGMAVALVMGSARNIKLTTPEDPAMAERLFAPLLEPRTGIGFDVHRFAAGDHVWLGGVRIPHSHRLDGHSDADVALHALTDAVLGALGDGDIGEHFPPDDARWRGAPSRLFLADAARRVAERAGRIMNVDVTILCEGPRIAPHRSAMCEAIAGILGLAPGRVGVKATTMERLGFIGRHEGIAAMAVASLMLPPD